MQLQPLSATPCLCIYEDGRHDGLFLDWRGDLTLPAVQEACVAVAQCYLARTYSRVLSSKLQVSTVGSRVGTWLGAEFLPYLTIVGVEQLAWVSVPSVESRQAQMVVNRLPTLALNLFETTKEAISWLLQPHFSQSKGYLTSSQPPVAQARLAQGVQLIREEAQLVRQEVQNLKQKVWWKPVKSW